MENTNYNTQSSNSILNAFKNKFATKVNAVYVNSLKREVNFREVSVVEQKSLSKTMIENENRQDIAYDTQCALINRLCLENDNAQLRSEAKDAARNALPEAAEKENVDLSTPKGASFAMKFTNEFVQKYIAENSFDIYSLTEFDRIRILMEIYQNNYFKDEITYKCKECGCENKYVVDFSKIIDRLNAFDLEDQVYTTEDNQYIYHFTVNYPTVRNVSQFYKTYAKKYKGASQKEKDILNNLANMGYVNLYIKNIELIDKNTGNKDIADLSLMTYSEAEQLIEMFPQNIILSEEDGVLQFIIKNLIGKIDSVFQYEKCTQCGAESSIGVGSVGDFL